MSVLPDVRVERHLRGILESVKGRDLVAGLDVTIGQIVVRDLPDGVRPVPHHREVVDGSFVVSCGVEDRTGVEIVIAVHIPVGVPGHVVIFLGLLRVALREIRLRDDPREMPPTLLRCVLKKFQTILKHVGVVLFHESALRHVVGGHLGETRIPRRLFEPTVGLVEILPGVVYVAEGVPRRSGVVRMRQLVSLLEQRLGLRQIPFLKV